MPVFRLTEKISFPPPCLAEKEGLLAVGGDLSQERLLSAYEKGIFPWYSEGDPILWWSPDPRLVLYPEDLIVSKSLRKVIKKKIFDITLDKSFEQVIGNCSNIRAEKNESTWIVKDMKAAYTMLHQSGYAHSVEAWLDGELAGGLYGLSLGSAFFGESMFSRKSDASKVAFVFLVEYLKQRSYDMIDCQLPTAHLKRFGAKEIRRDEFLKQLEKSLKKPTRMGPWCL